MSAQRWRLIREVFHATLDRPEAERTAFLVSACGDDADLRAEVQSLLASHVQAPQFLSEPAALPEGLGGLPGPRAEGCGQVREAAEVWASLERGGGLLTSEEQAESLSARTAAGACATVAAGR